jgi:hypothetical protein
MVERATFRTVLGVLLVAALVGCGPTAGSPPAVSPSPSLLATPITGIQMASGLAPDGSAASPTTVFDSATDQKIIAVLTLANLAAGTKIGYTRYRDGKYVNSKSAVLKSRSKYFHFTFKPKSGSMFTPGSYRMKFYINEKAAGETSFTIK